MLYGCIYIGLGLLLCWCLFTTEGRRVITYPGLTLLTVAAWPLVIVGLLPNLMVIRYRGKVVWKKK